MSDALSALGDLDPRQRAEIILGMFLDTTDDRQFLDGLCQVSGFVGMLEAQRKAENERLRQWKKALDEMKPALKGRVLEALDAIGQRGRPGSKTEDQRLYKGLLGKVSRRKKAEASATLREDAVSKQAQMEELFEINDLDADQIHILAELQLVELVPKLTEYGRNDLKEHAVKLFEKTGEEVSWATISPAGFTYSVSLNKDMKAPIISSVGDALSRALEKAGTMALGGPEDGDIERPQDEDDYLTEQSEQ